ncbi:MAG: GH25 family lysozyme [Bacteroidales bacterium]|nr:GH25 family lysozyme [Bacteroidales bacterium]MDY6000697.1 GH25 family lysozyme [Candidatus Cryptobacteroides sp.]
MTKKSKPSTFQTMPAAKKAPTRKAVSKKAGTRKPMARKSRKKVVKVSVWQAAAIAVVAALIVILLSQHFSFNKEYGAKVPQGDWHYGIDISHNNDGPIIWDSLYVMTDRRWRTVKDPYRAMNIKPVSFVYIKATEGATFKDCDFKTNWREAGKANVKRGAYHFFRSSKDGELQAENFIETVGKLRPNDLTPALDIETIHQGCSKELLNQRVLQWLTAIEKEYGKKPIVYASSSFIKDNLCEGIVNEYSVWVAHYRKQQPGCEPWKIWQVSDKAVVMGIPGLVDLDVMKIE